MKSVSSVSSRPIALCQDWRKRERVPPSFVPDETAKPGEMPGIFRPFKVGRGGTFGRGDPVA